MNPNDLAREVVDAAIKVHSALGPGLLESVYEACLAHEIAVRGLRVERQVVLPVRYGEVTVEAGLRLDLLVGEGVVVEIKAVESLQPIHAAADVSQAWRLFLGTPAQLQCCAYEERHQTPCQRILRLKLAFRFPSRPLRPLR